MTHWGDAEVAGQNARDYAAYKRAGKVYCSHPGCETRLNYVAWRNRDEFCSMHHTLREGVGFCAHGHDMYEVGMDERTGRCKTCLGAWELDLKRRKAESRRADHERFQATLEIGGLAG